MKNAKERLLEYYRTKAKITSLKITIKKPKTKAKLKKVVKTEKVTRTIKERKEASREERKRRLKKFKKWSDEKINKELLDFEDLVRVGASFLSICAKMGYKEGKDLKYFIEEQYSIGKKRKTLKQIRQGIEAKVDTPSTEWRKFPKGGQTFGRRVALGFCPVVSSDERSVRARKYPPVKKEGDFCKNLDIIPDMSVQPIKRLRKAVHSFDTADWWTKERKELDSLLEGVSDEKRKMGIRLNFKHKNTEKLLKELTITLASSEEDKYVTHEGGIIISKALSENENLHEGDKLLGLHGLKGIVCEVRVISTDILINKNQIWGGKASSKNGGAVLELLSKGALKCFYQSTHKVQAKEYKDETGKPFATAKISPKARFSPDVLPFLVYYLGYQGLYDLTKHNRERMHDVLRLMNLSVENKKGFLEFDALKTLPEAHKDGELKNFGENQEGYFYKKKKPAAHLSKTPIFLNNEKYYPFYPKRLWIPDWLKKEGYLEFFNKKKGIKEKTDLAIFLTQDYEHKWSFRTNRPVIYLLYKTIYADIKKSIGYLIAVPKYGEEDIIDLNAAECIERDIEEGEEVIVWRPPVVAGRLPHNTERSNLLKLKVKFGAEPKTTRINTATMRLMFGDFDGDALYVMKIPENAANILRPQEELTAEIEEVKKEIKEIDELVMPCTKEKILLDMRTAFIRGELKNKGLTGDEIKEELAKRVKKLKLVPVNELRNNQVIMYEAEVEHDEAIVESEKIGKIGMLTKWGWLAVPKNEINKLIQATQSIEIMKDRPGKDVEEYETNKAYLEELKSNLIVEPIYKEETKAERKLRLITNRERRLKGEEEIKREITNRPTMKFNRGYKKFVTFLRKGAYETGLTSRDSAPEYGELHSVRLCPSKSMVAKWIFLLSGK